MAFLLRASFPERKGVLEATSLQERLAAVQAIVRRHAEAAEAAAANGRRADGDGRPAAPFKVRRLRVFGKGGGEDDEEADSDDLEGRLQ